MTESRLYEMLESELTLAAAISNKCWDYPYGEEDFRRLLEDAGHWVWFCRAKADVVGQCVYFIGPNSLEILEISVMSPYRKANGGSGYGFEMMNFIKRTAAKAGLRRITTVIREDALAGQLWLKRQGFRAISVLPENFEAFGERHDGYLMRLDADELWNNIEEK